MEGSQLPSFHGYAPPISLWKLVQQYAPHSEQVEIKNMLGESEVEESEELHKEVEMLLDIWQEFRAESERTTQLKNILPEPPGVRNRLKQEIHFFLESIHRKAKEEGRDPSKPLANCSANVINYVLNDAPSRLPTMCCGEELIRPMTAMNRDGRDTPLLRGTPNSDRMSLSSTVSDEVESMSDKLNILQLDDVVQHLRQYLEEELAQLVNDVQFLQQCLEDEAAYRSAACDNLEPNLTELREERAKLEKELLGNVSTISRSVAKSSPSHRAVPHPGRHLPPAHQVTQNGRTLVSLGSTSVKGGDGHHVGMGTQEGGGASMTGATGQFTRDSLATTPKVSTIIVDMPRPSSAIKFRKMVVECRGDGH